MKTELEKAQIKILEKESGREGVDFLIGDNQLYLEFNELDTAQRSIKVSKQDLEDLKDNLFISLILLMENLPKVVYIIPSKDLTQSKSNIFTENEVSLMPSFSNWEIKV